MKTTDITTKVWIDANGDLIGPFETAEQAKEYIDDRDDHGFDVRNWDMLIFKLYYTSISSKKEFVVKNGHIHCINN